MRLLASLAAAIATACACGNPGLTHSTDYDAGPPKPECGNGRTEEGEACDGADLGGQTCVSKGFLSGDIACTADCRIDTSKCSRLCGNGRIDSIEECDGADLGGAACVDWGFDRCDDRCKLSKANCVTTLFAAGATIDTLSVPQVRFGPSLTAARSDLALALPSGNPGPQVEIHRYDSAAGAVRERVLGIPEGFALPLLYADVTGDKLTDAVVPSVARTELKVRWWDPAVARFQEIVAAVGCPVYGIAAGDVNEDGRPDLVAAACDPSGPRTAMLLANAAANPFSGARDLGPGEPIEGLQLVDANGDKHLDVVFRRVSTNALGVLAGDGKGAFAALPDAAAGAVTGRPMLADLDADGRLDLVVVDAAVRRLKILPATGSLTFGTAVEIGTLGDPVDVRVADLDGDGAVDVAFASQPGQIAALKNAGAFTFRRQDLAVAGMDFASFDVGDFDGDGDLDAAVAGRRTGGNAGRVVILRNLVR